jgi:two-component SAPR family response regulator
LRLASSVTVDLHLAWDKARQIMAGLSPLPLDCDAYISDLTQEILPGWPEEWLIPERERWGQVRQHALESLALQFRADAQYLPAIQSALAAIAVDPIRENAHRILIEVHADEGNVACALMRYQHYEALLRQELGVAPSSRMTRLIQDVIADSTRRRQAEPTDGPQRETPPNSRSLGLQTSAGHPPRHAHAARHQPDGAPQGQRPR